ncbi:MAG: TRAP transporter fused permease subunit [Pseudolabrys sp.]|nr:TRAP transporter fused permease subunit [Pseudolabrys sp.]
MAASVLATILTTMALLWSLDVPQMLGRAFYTEQFIAPLLGTAIAIAFLTMPPLRGRKRPGIGWYDVLAAAAALAVGWYMGVRFPDLINLNLMRPPEVLIPGLVLVVLLFEATRRAAGPALTIIIAVFLLYGLLGNFMPGAFAARAQAWDRLAAYLAFDGNGILGTPLAIASTVVVAFIFFGNLLVATRGSQFFTDAAVLGMGRFRGGPMKISVVASMLFGSISGSAVANVVATGVISIPMMKRGGYPAHKAAAIESVASTGGQLMPPVMGAAAFLMAEFLQLSYVTVALAALVPGLLYYLALFIQADLEAGKLGLKPVPREEFPAPRMVLTGFHFVIAFAVLIVALFSFNWLPDRAAYLASLVIVVSSIVFGYGKARPTLAALWQAVVSTGYGVVEILLISGAAGIVIGVLSITGLSFNLTYALITIGGGNIVVLLVLCAIVSIILGMGMPTLGVYVLLATLIAPAMVELGIDKLAAHLYVLYFGMMSMITPPVAIAAFAAAAIAGAEPMRTGFAAMKFGWTAFIIPFLFVASPSLLMKGEPMHIVAAVTTAVIGVWLVSVGMAGYFLGHVGWLLRALFIVTGIMSLIPANAFAAALWTDIIGLLAGAGLVVWRFLTTRDARAAARSSAPAAIGASTSTPNA